MRTLAFAFLVAAACGCTRVDNSGGGGGVVQPKAIDPWPAAIGELARQPDTVTARRVLNQLNGGLAAIDRTLPEITADELGIIKNAFRPSPDELGDLTAKGFTPMDGNHLGESLFFREVARSLDVGSLPPEQQARIAFDWVCRQMYFRPWSLMSPEGPVPVPPSPPRAALRRGFGSGIEREFAFLALARQLGLNAVLIGPPGAENARRWELRPDRTIGRGPFWAVGVKVDDDYLLFDPWAGAAIPTPDGKGIMRLSAAKATPALATAWIDSRLPAYPVKSEAVAASEPYFTAPINSFTPRMRVLEEQLAAEFGVKLAAAIPPGVAVHGPAHATDPFALPHVLGSFTPRDDGGYDTTPQGPQQLAWLAALADTPPPESFLIPDDVPAPGHEAFRGRAAALFKQYFSEGGYRDRIHRGQFNEVVRQLVELDRKFAGIRDAVRNDSSLGAEIQKWYATAREAYDALQRSALPENAADKPAARAAVDALWGNNMPVYAVIQAAVAEVGGREAAYLLALAKHEQAERSQIRLLRQSSDANAARAAADWAAARAAWSQVLDDVHPDEARLEHARRLTARAAALAANPRAGAP